MGIATNALLGFHKEGLGRRGIIRCANRGLCVAPLSADRGRATSKQGLWGPDLVAVCAMWCPAWRDGLKVSPDSALIFHCVKRRKSLLSFVSFLDQLFMHRG